MDELQLAKQTAMIEPQLETPVRQIFLDTETTGLECKLGHRIIEIAGVEMCNRRLTNHHFHSYLNPEREIDAGALSVHGISRDFLLDKPHFADIAAEFLDFVRGAELVIHNAAFDIGFINAELALLDMAPIDTVCQSVCDTLRMAKDLHPGKKNNLNALCERYGVEQLAPHPAWRPARCGDSLRGLSRDDSWSGEPDHGFGERSRRAQRSGRRNRGGQGAAGPARPASQRRRTRPARAGPRCRRAGKQGQMPLAAQRSGQLTEVAARPPDPGLRAPAGSSNQPQLRVNPRHEGLHRNQLSPGVSGVRLGRRTCRFGGRTSTGRSGWASGLISGRAAGGLGSVFGVSGLGPVLRCSGRRPGPGVP
jgi:DNA polymerase III epsilon subunit family exonuclease